MFRPEHPNPAKKHASFINLNGTWEFEFDNTLVGIGKKYYEREHLNGKIEVPFCPESRLSGIGNTDFINAVWYRRDIDIPEEALDGNVLITFGAVDYEAIIYINGSAVCEHTGGYTPITVNATTYLHKGINSLCVYAKDNIRKGIPHGKQSELLHSHNCDYTRTTGIWQTVYMEFLPKSYIKNAALTPDAENQSVSAVIETNGPGVLTFETFFEGKPMGKVTKKTSGGTVLLETKLAESHLWEVGCGRLYDVKITFEGDVYETYFGLRSVRLSGKKFLINNKSVFQKLVLDQGYYEDGIYTAPTAQALEEDIKLSMSLGFNGARPHMKVFEPLYFYYADKYGYITWGEFPNWGLDFRVHETTNTVIPQWIEAVERDFNHPSIVGWCPLNETHIDRYGNGEGIHDTIVRNIYLTTKALDKTRPCIDTSGYVHQKFSDIYDMHNYTQDPEHMRSDYAEFENGGMPVDERNMFFRRKSYYNGQPLFISEFGGARWSEETSTGKETSWGYGNDPQSEQEFFERFEGLCYALMDNKNIFGFCYTQLYDIEQEQNGLLYYNRSPKFEPAKFKAILDRKAKIED